MDVLVDAMFVVNLSSLANTGGGRWWRRAIMIPYYTIPGGYHDNMIVLCLWRQAVLARFFWVVATVKKYGIVW